MAKINIPGSRASKTGFQGGRIENKVYQMICFNCDWKSGKSTFRTALRLESDQHKRFTRDIKTGKMHRVEMVKVGD